MKSGPIWQALENRFAAPKWALMYEVQDATGMRATRSADAVAMGLWPSVGLELWGFEVKRSRADWLREVKDPTKAIPIQSYCDRWWLVAQDARVARVEELPPTWGMMVLRGDRLHVARSAPKLEAKPIGRLALAALLRRSWEDVEGADAFCEFEDGGGV